MFCWFRNKALSSTCNYLTLDFATASNFEDVEIESAHFPDVYLRMDGSDVIKFLINGGGIVNAQKGASFFEQFRIHYDYNNIATIESKQFPGLLLIQTNKQTNKNTKHT